MYSSYSSAIKSLPPHLPAVDDPIARRTSSLGASIVRLWVFSVVLYLFASFASAASVNLAWDAVTAPDLAGYKVHYGTASRNYGTTVDAGKSTTAAISGLQEGKTYFFAATAYDTKGNSSGFSNEVSHTVPELDTDNDGLKDHEEIKIYGTDPNRADTDGDGLRDGDEIKIHHTDPKSVDTDGDGLSDKDEIQVYKTDPTQNDTDRDGTPDGVEVSKGSNPLDPKSIPSSYGGLFAVNAGGAQYKDATGLVYQADSRFSGGKTSGTTAPIAGTTDDALYQKVRFGDFSYAIPLPDGDYLVTLKFAETYFTKAGQRVFDVAVEGVDVINDLDLVAEAGPKTAYDLTIPAHVTDGVLNINFRSVVNYALVNAIVVEPTEVVFAVNAGGAQYTDATGLVYQADSRFSGGTSAGTTAPIAGTTDNPVYQRMRFGTFSYNIPLPKGDYLVTLKFAETYFTKAGQRVFDVAIEGVDVINDLDLVAEAGPKAAYDLTFPVLVTDGTLNINFRSVVNYALVNAIVVMGAAAAH